MKIEAVIGANYGDEGKGLFTEHLCRTSPKPLVVLSNGGCQRGHTVNNKELGIRHVFNHFGSGTLLGVPTVYSKTYLLNPIRFIQEHNELEKVGIHPKSFRSLECILQLPSDIFMNQVLERHRSGSNSKHGSCGMGIWETVFRNRAASLTFERFASMDDNAKKMLMLEVFEWQMEHRIKALDAKIDDEMQTAQKHLLSDGFIEHFISDFHAMESLCPSFIGDDLVDVDFSKHGLDVQTLIVENAQGLLLDTQYAPEDDHGRSRDVHTTPSKTGMAGVIAAIGNPKGSHITANYITRTYMTRHGAGPFPEEVDGLHFEDKTNMPNDWQGSLRFGKMSEDVIEKLLCRVKLDSIDVSHALVATHLNEVYCSKLVDEAKKCMPCFVSYEDDSSKIIHT